MERHTYLGSVCRNALILLVLAVGLRADDQATRLYQEGQKAEHAGDLLQAYMLYARAAALDPSNLAIAEHRNQAGNLAIKTTQIHDITTEPNPDSAFLQLIQSRGPGQIDEFGPAAAPPHLISPQDTKSFDLRGDAQTVFQKVGEAFGIQMLFEGGYQGPPPFPFRTGDLTMPEALRLLEAMTNSLVEPVNERTALVIRDTAQRRAEMTPTMSIDHSDSGANGGAGCAGYRHRGAADAGNPAHSGGPGAASGVSSGFGRQGSSGAANYLAIFRGSVRRWRSTLS